MEPICLVMQDAEGNLSIQVPADDMDVDQLAGLVLAFCLHHGARLKRVLHAASSYDFSASQATLLPEPVVIQ